VDKNLLKYNKWYNWLKGQENKKRAYSVFSYWLRVREENKSIHVNFSLTPKQLKSEIQSQYVDLKYDKIFRKLEKTHNLDFYSNKHMVQYLKQRIGSLSYSAKDLNYMLNQLFTRGAINIEDALLEVKNKMDYINNFYKNTKEINLIKCFDDNELDYDKHENEKFIIYVITPNEDQIKMLASPSWCLLYKDKHIESYYKAHEKIILSYFFDKQTKQFSMYGINVKKDKDESRYFISIAECIDMYNGQVINQNTIDIIKILRSGGTKKETITEIVRSNLPLIRKTIALLNEMESDEFILGFLISNIKTHKDLDRIIEYFINSKYIAILNRLIEIIKDEPLYFEWIQDGVSFMNRGGVVSEKEKFLFYDYIMNTDNSDLIKSFMENRKYILSEKQFGALYKNHPQIILDSIDVLFHLNNIKSKDYKYISGSRDIKKKLNENLLKLLVDQIKGSNNIKLLYFLKRMVGYKLLEYLPKELYFMFSIKDREYLLCANKFSINSVTFINEDHAINKNMVIQHHINLEKIETKYYFRLNAKTFNSNYQDYCKSLKKGDINTLVSEDLEFLNGFSLYDIRKFLNLFDEKVLQALFREILDGNNYIGKCQQVLKEINDSKYINEKSLFVMASMFPNKFQDFYKIVEKEDALYLIKIWKMIYSVYPVGAIAHCFSNLDIMKCLCDEDFLRNYASKESVNFLLNKIDLLEEKSNYLNYIKSLKSFSHIARIENIRIDLKNNFKIKYGKFKYIQYNFF
jgi:hypothetical protein